MAWKPMVKTFLLLFLGACVGGLLVQSRQTPPVPPPPLSPTPGEAGKGEMPQSPAHTVAVYYFHGDIRCSTCNTMEKMAHDAVTAKYADALKSGRVEWRVLNRQSLENRALVQEFRLMTNSVIVEDLRDGKRAGWKELPELWKLIDSPDEFAALIQDTIKTYQEGAARADPR